MEVALELIMIDMIKRLLCHSLYIVNGGYFELIMIKTIVRVLCHCLYVVNGGCSGVDNHRNYCESALPLLACSEWRLLQS